MLCVGQFFSYVYLLVCFIYYLLAIFLVFDFIFLKLFFFYCKPRLLNILTLKVHVNCNLSSGLSLYRQYFIANFLMFNSANLIK